MAQLFHPSFNVLARASIFFVIFLVSAVTWISISMYDSGYTTNVNTPVEQPVPFSHKRHVDGNGISCEYCHTSVATSSYAGIPPTFTCMTCHSQIFVRSPMLQPVRTSFQTKTPLNWIRVNDLPEFVYFNHSIHIAKGVGCVTCHGRIDQMPLTWRQNTLFMSWCLDCHRAPEQYLRPREEVFSMEWKPKEDQLVLGRRLVKEYNVQVHRITDCSTCHR
jgi:hypothetical protein